MNTFEDVSTYLGEEGVKAGVPMSKRAEMWKQIYSKRRGEW